MIEEELRQVIKKCDEAINGRDFGAALEFYSDDAVLVVRPGVFTKGKAEIRKALEGISAYFGDSLTTSHDKLAITVAGDTALVLGKRLAKARLKTDPDFSVERISTYVFKKEAGAWRCIIDNSCISELLEWL
ncbi:MAG TPA: DUF4440 domain-containing protein [Elusimicrobiales bacterium]|nr:DUF4440 domain-containing protein [Elusimicrobiales bacterium]